MVALMVAFGSAAKRHGASQQVSFLHRQVGDLRQENRELQERLRWTEARFAQSHTLGKQLNEALLAEQTKNRALNERLQRISHKDAASSG